MLNRIKTFIHYLFHPTYIYSWYVIWMSQNDYGYGWNTNSVNTSYLFNTEDNVQELNEFLKKNFGYSKAMAIDWKFLNRKRVWK